MFIQEGGLRRILFAVASLLVFVGFTLILIRALSTGSLVIIGGWMLAVSLIVLAGLAYTFATRNAEKSKPKREGEDMYTLIDRLVDDLDEDEMAYLKKRLDDQHDPAKDDLAKSVENLLDRRSQNRLP